jgi:hypothetical protein
MMLVGVVVWHGTTDELAALVNAIAEHCTCGVGNMTGSRAPTCTAHLMLLDQRTMDHLAFVKARAGQYQEREHNK